MVVFKHLFFTEIFRNMFGITNLDMLWKFPLPVSKVEIIQGVIGQ